MVNSLQEFLEMWANKYADEYKEKVGLNTNIARSVKTRVEFNGSNFDIFLDLNEYWKWIEYGRKPGKQPPIEAMLKIARSVIPRPYTLPTGKQIIPDEKQLAYLIGRKIGRDGVKAKPYLKEIKDEMFEELVDGIREIMIIKIKEEIIK